MNENLFKLEAEIKSMTLMSLARKDRGKKDPLLKIAAAIVSLEEQICEKESIIREQSIISFEGGVPKVEGFHDESVVETTQEQIAVLTNNKLTLKDIVNEIEGVFAKFGLQAMSMEALDLRIDEARDKAVSIARAINRLARKLLNDSPALTLPELFADVELQTLESTRAAAIIEGNAEAQRLIELKDSLLPLCSDGSIIAEAVFHPMRAAVSDPAKISQLRSA
jgi:hypothetical protein